MKPTRQPPVTLPEVATAMRELREEGEDVSVRAVRARVGRGSMTTLSRFMEAVRSGNETPEQHLEQFPAKLEALCREMVGALDELAVERVSQERSEVEAVRRNVESRWNGLTLEKETAVQGLEAEKRVTADLRQRLAGETQKLDAVNVERDEFKSRAVKAEALNDQLNERLLEYSRKIDDLKAHIENYTEQSKQQRQHEANEHAAKVGMLEQSLSNSRANELRLTELIGNVQRESEKLAAANDSITLRAEQAEAKQADSQALISHLSVEQTKSQKRESALGQQLAKAIAARDEKIDQMTVLQGQLIATQKQHLDDAAESRSYFINLVEHSRRVFELAKASVKKTTPEFQELASSQRAIEQLYLGKA